MPLFYILRWKLEMKGVTSYHNLIMLESLYANDKIWGKSSCCRRWQGELGLHRAHSRGRCLVCVSSKPGANFMLQNAAFFLNDGIVPVVEKASSPDAFTNGEGRWFFSFLLVQVYPSRAYTLNKYLLLCFFEQSWVSFILTNPAFLSIKP